MSIYDYKVKNQAGNDVSLAKYKGKVLLIINSATECGFTPQYENLQNLYNQFHENGFEILDFPCNQFGHQAPGTNEDIAQFCISRFGVTFPIFSKIEVNGKSADPLFSYLKDQKGFSGVNEAHPYAKMMKEIYEKNDPNYEESSDIKWNFTKFAINSSGEVVARFEPTDDMEDVQNCIKNLL